VPFANLQLDYHGQKLSLHDYFFAKSVDALKRAVCWHWSTTHFRSKQNPPSANGFASEADFLGAIRPFHRMPSNAKARQDRHPTSYSFASGLRAAQPTTLIDEWLRIGPLAVEGREVTVNRTS